LFKRDVIQIKDLILKNLRAQGLETPLLQKRLIDSWQEVAGEMIAGYTENVYIRNQTLYVKLSSPALRADLSMMRKEMVQRLNAHVGTQVIVDIKYC
jgi:predicted nucleic acid-binding Zn ribbon protein